MGFLFTLKCLNVNIGILVCIHKGILWECEGCKEKIDSPPKLSLQRYLSTNPKLSKTLEEK